jgi:hypothetical protein
VRCHQDIGKRIIKALGTVKVVKLTSGHVEKFLNAMVRDGYATFTIRMTRSVLVRSIRRA